MDYTVLILVLAAIVTAGVERVRTPVKTAAVKTGHAIERVVTLGKRPKAKTAAADVVTVMITPASTSGKPGIKVPFVGTATSSAGAKITTWTWNFGDKIWCTSPNFCGLSVAHTYPNIGVYAVTLTATDATGASGTGTATVTVSKDALNVVATVLSGQGMTHGQPVTIGYTDSGSTSQITTITTSCGDGSAPVVQNLFYQPPAANGQLTITGTTGGTSAWICIYAAAGDYEAQVSVTDTLGVTASAQADVMVITLPGQGAIDGILNYGGTATTPGWYPNIVFCATDAAKATNCALPRQQLVCTLGAATCISPQ